MPTPHSLKRLTVVIFHWQLLISHETGPWRFFCLRIREILVIFSPMRIGLLSDTHGFLDAKVFDHFADCDEVWHAGDIGDLSVAAALEKFKPFKAVFGNIDPGEVRIRYPEDLWFVCGGLTFLITHIAGTPPNYNPRIRKMLKERIPDVLICGHSHILRIGRDQKQNNMLFINPGAAGNQGFHRMKTLVRFEISNAGISKMEVIEMGKRGIILP
jgi:uncharacterized protein